MAKDLFMLVTCMNRRRISSCGFTSKEEEEADDAAGAGVARAPKLLMSLDVDGLLVNSTSFISRSDSCFPRRVPESFCLLLASACLLCKALIK